MEDRRAVMGQETANLAMLLLIIVDSFQCRFFLRLSGFHSKTTWKMKCKLRLVCLICFKSASSRVKVIGLAS
jgi:hypothetical protein